MASQADLLASAKKIDERLGKAKQLVKEHKKSKSKQVKAADSIKNRQEAKKNGLFT